MYRNHYISYVMQSSEMHWYPSPKYEWNFIVYRILGLKLLVAAFILWHIVLFIIYSALVFSSKGLEHDAMGKWMSSVYVHLGCKQRCYEHVYAECNLYRTNIKGKGGIYCDRWYSQFTLPSFWGSWCLKSPTINCLLNNVLGMATMPTQNIPITGLLWEKPIGDRWTP